MANLAIDAALDSRSALYDLGVEFYSGRRVRQNYANAALLWRKAVALGSVGAQNNLGYLLFNGLGIERDAEAAVTLWRSAAQAGHIESQIHLGDAIFRGMGTGADDREGLAWAMCAARRARDSNHEDPELGGGHGVAEDANALVELLSKSATPDEVDAAAQLASSPLCRPTTMKNSDL